MLIAYSFAWTSVYRLQFALKHRTQNSIGKAGKSRKMDSQREESLDEGGRAIGRAGGTEHNPENTIQGQLSPVCLMGEERFRAG